MPDKAKFNRPDPQRDWDWLRPHTLNLYEYSFNDPVNNWDPNGFGVKNIYLKNYGKNKVYVHPDSNLATLGTNYSKNGMRQNGPSELGNKSGPYHKTVLINVVAELDTGDNPNDFTIKQSAIASSKEGIQDNLEGKDSPIERNISFDASDSTLSMVDVPGLSGYSLEGVGVDIIVDDSYFGVFETSVTDYNTGTGETLYWQVIITVDQDGNAQYDASTLSQEEYEMYKQGLLSSKKITEDDEKRAKEKK